MAYIDGKIPPIGSKNSKIGDFALHKRKISPYLPRSELHFAFNRKISVYFSFASYLIKGSAVTWQVLWYMHNYKMTKLIRSS